MSITETIPVKQPENAAEMLSALWGLSHGGKFPQIIPCYAVVNHDGQAILFTPENHEDDDRA